MEDSRIAECDSRVRREVIQIGQIIRASMADWMRDVASIWTSSGCPSERIQPPGTQSGFPHDNHLNTAGRDGWVVSSLKVQ